VAERNIDCEVIGLGIPDKFIEQATQEEQYSACGFNAEDIYKVLATALKK